MYQTQYFYYFCRDEDAFYCFGFALARPRYFRYYFAVTTDNTIFIAVGNPLYALLAQVIRLVVRA